MSRPLLDPSVSSSSSFIKSSFLIQMDKRVFKNWVLHIPHRLRDLLWIVSTWSLVAPIFSSLIMSRASSCVCSSQSLAESNHFLLAHIPRMNESHEPGRPIKVVITISALFTSSSTASSCSLIWETLVKYDCMVSALWILTFFNCFLKVIFWFMFFPSNILVKESNISLGVFRENTYGIRWYLIESAMILLSLTKFFLCKALASCPLGTGMPPLMQVSNSFPSRTSEIIYFHAQNFFSFAKLVIKMVW